MKHLVRSMAIALVIGLLATFSVDVKAADDKGAVKELANFPTSVEGLTRQVIILPHKKNESDYKVEIIPGKTMSVDCNNHRLMGTLTEEDLQGWGYTYFVFKSDGLTASTMMMCNTPDTAKFVSGQSSMVDYNSKLPIVVYTPQGFEVKYRIWEAGKLKTATTE